MVARLCLALHVLWLGVLMAPPSVCAQSRGASSGLSDVALPGGLSAALAVLNDPVPGDRAQFLIEVIRRTYATPVAVKNDPRAVALRALLAEIDRARQAGVPTAHAEMLPLPLTSAIWTGVVFGGRAAPDTLVSSILESRNASLLYYGLMSLDGATRAWIASQPVLLAEIGSRRAAAFAVAAPGVRVAEDRVRVLLRGYAPCVEGRIGGGGGRPFYPHHVRELDGVFDEIVADLAHQYVLSYAPSNVKRDDTWRNIKVRVRNGKFDVRARRGYRASRSQPVGS